MIAAPGGTGAAALKAALVLPHAASSAFTARRALRKVLAASMVPEPIREATILVLSELLSNAVKHARPLEDGKVRLSWCVTADQVEIAVTDGGSVTRPRVSTALPSESGGRGLAIVGSLAREWGVRDEQEATTVWACVAASPVRPDAGPRPARARRTGHPPGSSDHAPRLPQG